MLLRMEIGKCVSHISITHMGNCIDIMGAVEREEGQMSFPMLIIQVKKCVASRSLNPNGLISEQLDSWQVR